MCTLTWTCFLCEECVGNANSNEEGVFHGFDISLPRVPPTRWHPYTWPLGRHTIDRALLGARRILVIPLSEDGLSRPR